MSSTLPKPPAVTVGGFPEPDGTQPMSPAEFRMVREGLGLTGDGIAEYLGLTSGRQVRKWEAGTAPIPDGVRVELEKLEEVASGLVAGLVAELRDAADCVLSIPAHDTEGSPAGWWRMIAWRVALEVPGLYVRYSDAEA